MGIQDDNRAPRRWRYSVRLQSGKLLVYQAECDHPAAGLEDKDYRLPDAGKLVASDVSLSAVPLDVQLLKSTVIALSSRPPSTGRFSSKGS